MWEELSVRYKVKKLFHSKKQKVKLIIGQPYSTRTALKPVVCVKWFYPLCYCLALGKNKDIRALE